MSTCVTSEHKHEVGLIPPYGGELVNLMVDEEKREALQSYATHLPSLRLNARAVCDLELLAIGAFSPLDRFMGEQDFHAVLDEMRLANGYLFPIPITLPVEPTAEVRLGQEIALRDARNKLLAIMSIRELYRWDPVEVADKVFGSQDLRHPMISEMHGLDR